MSLVPLCNTLWDQQKGFKHPTVILPRSIFLLFPPPTLSAVLLDSRNKADKFVTDICGESLNVKQGALRFSSRSARFPPLLRCGLFRWHGEQIPNLNPNLGRQCFVLRPLCFWDCSPKGALELRSGINPETKEYSDRCFHK